MITRLRLVRFKRFDREEFDLSGDAVILAGPNNSGKTTVLHALAAWHLAVVRWIQERGKEGAFKKRIGISLDEFTALPLREMNLMWLNRHTARKRSGEKTPKPAPVYIEVCVQAPRSREESLTIEFLYAAEKLVYVRPVMSPEKPEPVDRIPATIADLQVVHIPAFSAIGINEPRHSTGMQRKLVGEGRAGEIVRNLLLEIWEQSKGVGETSAWDSISADIKRLFQVELLPPEGSDARPYVRCEFRPLDSQDSQRMPRLDVASAGSGFHQVLMLLSFVYGRPAAVLLLDEPDAHLHFILQREIMDHLRHVASARQCKLLLATHSEVLLDDAEPDGIIAFVGARPRRLIDARQKRVLTETLKLIRNLDLVQAREIGCVLYTEDESDYKFLREWARTLGHDAQRFFDLPYVYPLRGKGKLNEARKHLRCLRQAFPEIDAICVLDLDHDEEALAEDSSQPGFNLLRWGRYEIENYLINIDVVKRFFLWGERAGNLFTHEAWKQDMVLVEEAFGREFPPGIDWLKSDARILRDIKGGDFLTDVLSRTSRAVPKRDLYMVAACMRKEEIHDDIKRVLDRIAAASPVTAPVGEINGAIDDDGIVEEEDPILLEKQ
jgi:AAA domain, putative AbiEii toxin, Type IV TA system/AAA domain